ncbi:uncharacterized protein [Fopius arisanus]|uniref:Uncharacterized protein isoform X2 n=1 Tax=Fopius arisanus TaxID=64838 RepID=A0A9R1TJD4_9HYME|nr:PREDICTED: uncharacterized protein LOC105271671 isoform X2 [Fopius arisanus]
MPRRRCRSEEKASRWPDPTHITLSQPVSSPKCHPGATRVLNRTKVVHTNTRCAEWYVFWNQLPKPLGVNCSSDIHLETVVYEWLVCSTLLYSIGDHLITSVRMAKPVASFSPQTILRA